MKFAKVFEIQKDQKYEICMKLNLKYKFASENLNIIILLND